MVTKKDIDERFWGKVHLEDRIFPENGCMLWTGAKNAHGYGRFWSGRNHLAHRYIYERLRGPIAKGLQTDHLCRVRACVNPDHLELVGSAENTERGNTGLYNRSKTHCPAGHEYTPDNILWQIDGRRLCKLCRSEINRRYRQKKGLKHYAKPT